MLNRVDLFEYLYCSACYHVTQISGSMPGEIRECEKCKSKKFSYPEQMSANELKNFFIQRELLKRK